MPKFGKGSLAQLETVHDDLSKIAEVLIRYYDFTVVCGFRNEQQQNEAYEKGFSTKKWPKSMHNKYPSLAMDCVPYPSMWEDKDKLLIMSGLIIGVAINLFEEGRICHLIRWGGDWNRNWEIKDEKFFDVAHFELVSV